MACCATVASDAAWRQTCAAIARNDARTRGIVVLGLGAEEAALAESFAIAARYPLVRGFAVGRTIHAEAGARFLKGEISEDAAAQIMADNYARLCGIWDRARAAMKEKVA